jgi:hypothetical protein
MNERIRELAEQAFFDCASGQASDRMYTFSDHKMQQFAELIVRECAQLARDTDLEDVEGGDSAVLYAASEQIKKHFGVAE